MKIIKTILICIQISSFIISLLFILLGLYEEIMGSPSLIRLLENFLHRSIDYNKVLLIGYLSFAVMIITYFIQKKLFS